MSDQTSGSIHKQTLRPNAAKAKKSRNDKLEGERLLHGWTQEALAEKLGVDARTVRRWESGHPVRPLNISGLTRLFGKSAEELGLITAQARYGESLAILKELDHQWLIVLAIEGLAMVVGAQGQLTEAARLWGASKALRETIGSPVPPRNHILYQQLQDVLRTQLGENAFTSALIEGKALALDEILAML